MNLSWPEFLLIGVLLLAVVLVLFWHPQLSRSKTSSYAGRQRTNSAFYHDDRYWYGGLFYHNPDDPAIFVPKRFGLGWTLNFAHPQARLVLLGLLLLVLLPPLIVALFSIIFPGSIHSSGCHPSGCNFLP